MDVRTTHLHQRIIVFGVFSLLVLLAWLALVWPPGSGVGGLAHGQMHDVSAEPESVLAPPRLAMFVAGWVVMTLAMMLPSTLSMVETFARLVLGRPDGPGRVVLFVNGYLAIWTGFGLLAYLADRSLHLAADLGWLPDGSTKVHSGGVLLLAGAYQFAPLKRRCLSRCRSPLSFLMRHWRDGRHGALSMGLRHGIWCIGCCWALMLLMFALEAAQLEWMLGLTLLMFVEKVARRGELVGTALASCSWSGER